MATESSRKAAVCPMSNRNIILAAPVFVVYLMMVSVSEASDD